MSGCFFSILRPALLLLVHINVLATANADSESESGKPIVFSAFNAGSITGLDFPGSDAVKTTMRFKFTNPHNDGCLFTELAEGRHLHLASIPTATRWLLYGVLLGNDDGQNNLNTFLLKRINGNSIRAADTYYGAHPYPRRSNRSLHHWEISIEQNDYVNGQVLYDRWYTQTLRVWSVASNRKFHEFYWDLPKTDSRHVVSHVSPASWANNNPPAPALTWGDAPWAPGKEVWKGILRGIQIYSGLLSMTDI